jgi:hypothetical protein
MASLLARLFGLPRKQRDARFDRLSVPILPTPDTQPIATPSPSETPPPLKNWCHPLKDARDPLAHLTHLANAAGGYYPIGRSGLFHGGVHFDSATGVTQDQAVHCLADGEVVAFRVDTHSPTTRYFIDTRTLDKPFARNFVLVRHRLQPPKIPGSTDTPPSLTFYSLYMHLRDWAKYQEDSALPRPAYWPQNPMLKVKQTVTDVLAGHDQPGLNVRHEDGGKVIDLLPRGAAVTVSGTWSYRKLENSLAPSRLINADGSVAGYIAASILQPIAGNQHRITSSEEWVNVRAEPKFGDNVISKLPTRSVVTVSGEGPFRKLERVNQYVHFNSLERVQEPPATDQIVVLEQPVPIKAGELIGHLGDYQDSGAESPEQKLHLEVFSGDNIDVFFADSRAWAQRLPAKDKTWLKLAAGTAVVAHQEGITGPRLKALSTDSPRSAADLLVPKSLLDGLPAERKIQVPGDPDRKPRNWYRLDGLLHDADDQLLDGWVCEEVGVTPWLSPWSWEGYEVIYDYSLPKHAMASFFSAVNRFSEPQRERFRPLAEKDHKGRMKTRLYEIIDTNRDGKMTASELKAALGLPAKAQAISQMVLRMESEWFYQEQKWDALDELLGHNGSTPHWNWVAEKERIEQMGWWSEVADKVGLPAWGRPYHFHPIGLVVNFQLKDECACGCCIGAKFMATRYGHQFGPVYWGKSKLADFKGWDLLVDKGTVTTAERTILVAMSENEGNLDALQSYDSEILTAGAMQKTISPQGAGELSQQVFEFKEEHPSLYQSLFKDCGWEVKAESGRSILYYNGITGPELKALLRSGFDQAAYESKVKIESKPLAVFVHAITSNEYITKQVMDFVHRLRKSILVVPTGLRPRTISSYIRSNLGKAIVLDHHVNRPGNVASDFSGAITAFRNMHPEANEDPAHWGVKHSEYESALLEIYGPSRRMTDATLRYQSLKSKL